MPDDLVVGSIRDLHLIEHFAWECSATVRPPGALASGDVTACCGEAMQERVDDLPSTAGACREPPRDGRGALLGGSCGSGRLEASNAARRGLVAALQHEVTNASAARTA